MHGVPFDREWVVGQGKTVVLSLFLERGMLGRSGKEILKRLAPVHDGHLWGVLSNLQHPGELCSLDRVQLTAQRRPVGIDLPHRGMAQCP